MKWIYAKLKESKNHSAQWREDARKAYDFYAGKQWEEADKAALEQQGRPAVVFNRTARTVNAICGLEIQNRQEVRYLPRTIDDTGMNDVLTEASKWIRQQCDAEDEESESFQDMLISGIGWTETHLDYEREQDGNVLIGRVDPLEMFWDCSARKKNLVDKRWCARVKKVSIDEVKAFDPSYEPGEKEEDFLEEDPPQPHDASPPYYESEVKDSARKKMHELIHFEWFELEDYQRVLTNNGNIVELSKTKVEVMGDQLGKYAQKSVKQRRRVYYCAYLCGSTLLERRKLEVQTGFTFEAMTGARDRNDNTWFGLVCLMIDPQRWANKWLTQIMHIINSNSKGGLIAETDAFENQRKAEETWAKPDAITFVRPGGLQKIQQKEMTQYPAGIDRLLQQALEAINDVPGVNAELLGLVQREQPGVLENMRKQAGITMLALFFDAMRRYRKEQGRVMAEFIREYISDGRLVRIVGDEGAQYLPLVKDSVAFTYDVIVDEAPSSPNMKERVFSILSQLVPQLMQAGIPVPPDVLDYTPLPESLVQKWKGILPKPGDPPKPDPEMVKAQNQAQMDQAKLDMEAQKLELEKQRAALDLQTEQAKLALEREKLAADIQLEREKMMAEIQLDREKCMTQMSMDREKHAMTLDASSKPSSVIHFDAKGELAELAENIQVMARNNDAAIIESQKQLGEMLQTMAAMLSAPKEIVRDQNGRPVGVRTVLNS